jgi:hypothetical protein
MGKNETPKVHGTRAAVVTVTKPKATTKKPTAKKATAKKAAAKKKDNDDNDDEEEEEEEDYDDDEGRRKDDNDDEEEEEEEEEATVVPKNLKLIAGQVKLNFVNGCHNIDGSYAVEEGRAKSNPSIKSNLVGDNVRKYEVANIPLEFDDIFEKAKQVARINDWPANDDDLKLMDILMQTNKAVDLTNTVTSANSKNNSKGRTKKTSKGYLLKEVNQAVLEAFNASQAGNPIASLITIVIMFPSNKPVNMQQLRSRGSNVDSGRLEEQIDTAIRNVLGEFSKYALSGNKDTDKTDNVKKLKKIFIISGDGKKQVKYLKNLVEGLIKTNIMKKEGTEIDYMQFRQRCTVIDCLELFFEHCIDLDNDDLIAFDSKKRIVKNEIQELQSSASSN